MDDDPRDRAPDCWPPTEAEGVRQLSDEEFFEWVASGLKRRSERQTRRKRAMTRRQTPASNFIAWVIVWLFGAAVILALALGVVTLGKLVYRAITAS